MSKFYGTLSGDKGDATRTGNKYMSATAQCHDGSVTVELTSDGRVEVSVRNDSGIGGKTLLNVDLVDLLQANALSLK